MAANSMKIRETDDLTFQTVTKSTPHPCQDRLSSQPGASAALTDCRLFCFLYNYDARSQRGRQLPLHHDQLRMNEEVERGRAGRRVAGVVEGESGLRLMSVRHPPLPLPLFTHSLTSYKKGAWGVVVGGGQSSRRVLFHSQSELSLLLILFLHAELSRGL